MQLKKCEIKTTNPFSFRLAKYIQHNRFRAGPNTNISLHKLNQISLLYILKTVSNNRSECVSFSLSFFNTFLLSRSNGSFVNDSPNEKNSIFRLVLFVCFLFDFLAWGSSIYASHNFIHFREIQMVVYTLYTMRWLNLTVRISYI